ncbi:DUF4179 domain-containing protein [Sporosarcina limicola]|uniref:DUF4179 domain-containing protein n=1 Tax=Sporosarcina limicola TaxID=34101 RepID=A0A927R650_9BACL|nr:DUF4179 domain-containing protein [Sporosarcina limicola]MBE1556803.1 hypothetical protein [Sporosarcina limicola]
MFNSKSNHPAYLVGSGGWLLFSIGIQSNHRNNGSCRSREKYTKEEKEMPVDVRQSLDRTYDSIRTQSKKKKNRFIWKRITAAACALLITGAVLTNEQVRASINDFFSFGDRGIERAVSEGFSQENNSTATDQNINITLKQSFADANKIGMSFQLEFEDSKTFDNDVIKVAMHYRLKNGDGEYIQEFISDTKPLKGKGGYISGLRENNPMLDIKTGIVQYDVVLEFNKGNIPNLEDAVVEIESIILFLDYDARELIKEFGERYDSPVTIIDGKWDLAVANQDESKPVSTIEYVMDDPLSIIQVASAMAKPTSFNLNFSVDQVFEDESPFVFTMKVIDEEGNEYESDGFTIETRDNQTHISTNFPISSYNNSEKLRFIIEDIGEVELLKK